MRIESCISVAIIALAVIFLAACAKYDDVDAFMELKEDFSVTDENGDESIGFTGDESTGLSGDEVSAGFPIQDGDGNEEERADNGESDTEPLPAVHGIYVTASQAGIPHLLERNLNICLEYGLNAMVIDIRTEKEFTVKGWLPFADEWGVSSPFIPDITSVIGLLEDNGIYPIARLVTFRDDYTVDHRPELYIHNKDGTLWKDLANANRAKPWLNPYNRDTWDYVLEYAVAAAKMGFKEIQFDYVRFAAAASRFELADFGDIGDASRTDIITAFLSHAVEVLHPYGVRVSADVYGTIINSDLDASIVGQDYTMLSRVLDVICPMIYPSHFAEGTYNLKYPDLEPYLTVYNAMQKSNERLSVIPEGEHRATVRPWLQSFTAKWLGAGKYQDYSTTQHMEQIHATYDAGMSEWLFWDANNRYNLHEVFLDYAQDSSSGDVTHD